MTAEETIDVLRSRGCRLEARDGRLFVSPPEGLALSDLDRETLRAERAALLAALDSEAEALASRPAPFSWHDSPPLSLYAGLATAGSCRQPSCPEPPAGQEVEAPAGATLFWQARNGRPCPPDRAHRWCWAGGPRWYEVARNPPRGVPLVGPEKDGGHGP